MFLLSFSIAIVEAITIMLCKNYARSMTSVANSAFTACRQFKAFSFRVEAETVEVSTK
ncbi:MAG: hypothetical protein ACQEQO_12670 [Thermodesulfobacteriota bacterium]